MNTIANANPATPTRITLKQPIADLCPHSHEPQIGSSISITYAAADRLLELHAIREWIESQLSEALDVETLTQRAAQAAATALGVPVEVTAHYVLAHNLELTCTSSIAPAETNA